MDAAKLQDALDYGSTNLSFAVRVYRNGCEVGEDRAATVNRDQQFESWSMAKSVVSLIFGRAMTLGLIAATAATIAVPVAPRLIRTTPFREGNG